MIADQQMVISITASGYVKRLPLATYRQQRRGGVGVMGMNIKEDDYIEHLHICSTHDFLLFFTNRGKVYRLKVYELPEGSRTAKGSALVNLLPLREGEQVMAVIPTRDFKENKYLVFATAKGMIKKTEFLAYNTPIRADGIIAIKIRDGDELVQVRLTSGEDDILMVSHSGHASRFSREAGAADGPRHQRRQRHERLRQGSNRVLAMDIARDDTELFVVTENGYGKRTAGLRVPGQGPRDEGRADREADREEGRPRRRADRPRAPGPPLHLPERHGPAHLGQRHLADGPPDPGRQGDEHQGGRPGQRRRPGRRVRASLERRRRG